MINANLGMVVMDGPDFVIGAELLSIMEASVDERDECSTIIPEMVDTAKELDKIDILRKFAEAISNNL